MATATSDFLVIANLAISRGQEFAGLIILKRRGSPDAKIRKLRALLAAAGDAGIAGNINFA